MTHSKQVLAQYCDLLEEIKLRNDIVDQCLRAPVLSPQFMYELCFLQFRMITETIALGCLVLHGDVPGARDKSIRKAYSAEEIVKRLAQLHPDFYPKPVVTLESATGEKDWHPIAEPFLTQDELGRLWASCGDVLHRGTFMTAFERAPRSSDAVVEWRDKIVRLLNSHLIQLIDDNSIQYVHMRDEKDGRVWIYPFTRTSEPDGN